MNQPVGVWRVLLRGVKHLNVWSYQRKDVRHNFLNIVGCCVIVPRSQKQKQMNRKIKVLQTSQAGCSSGWLLKQII